MKKIELKIVVLLGIISVLVMSCASVAGSRITGFKYVAGNLRAAYYAGLPDTWEAARQALDEFQMSADFADQDGFAGILKGAMADGREFTIGLTRIEEQKTEVSVLIAPGDRDVSEAIQNKIEENLAAISRDSQCSAEQHKGGKKGCMKKCNR